MELVTLSGPFVPRVAWRHSTSFAGHSKSSSSGVRVRDGEKSRLAVLPLRGEHSATVVNDDSRNGTATAGEAVLEEGVRETSHECSAEGNDFMRVNGRDENSPYGYSEFNVNCHEFGDGYNRQHGEEDEFQDAEADADVRMEDSSESDGDLGSSSSWSSRLVDMLTAVAELRFLEDPNALRRDPPRLPNAYDFRESKPVRAMEEKEIMFCLADSRNSSTILPSPLCLHT